MTPGSRQTARLVSVTRYRMFKTVQYLGANAVTLLAHLGESLAGSNLSGAVLREADLKRTNLAGAILAQADLSYANLSDAVLDDCNCTEVDFTGANLAGLNARGCNFRSAFFDGTNLSGANLSGSDLSGCMCQGSDFKDVLADRCVGASSVYESAINPSSSLTLAATSLKGMWVRASKKLDVYDHSSDRIRGRLHLTKSEWIDLDGQLQHGRYDCEGEVTSYTEHRGRKYRGWITSSAGNRDCINVQLVHVDTKLHMMDVFDFFDRS